MSSRPTLCAFDPAAIPYQRRVIQDVRRNFDYSLGNHEILLSGSYGSAKTVLMSHLCVTHCLLNPGSRMLLGRKALPDLKRTIFREILNHIAADLVEGRDFRAQETTATIVFSNGSEIISTSWSDRKYKKVRSLNLSAACIEELIENDEEDREVFMEIKARLRRIPGIEENWLVAATNPGSPGEWPYRYFIEEKSPTRHVYYSRTDENPFLDPVYIEQLKRDLDPLAARRYIGGEWIELAKEVVYYAYDQKLNHKDGSYIPPDGSEVILSWDFNIGAGKPMSVVCMHFAGDHLHIFDEVVIEGMRTEDSCDELAGRGILDRPWRFIVTGDATGAHSETRSKRSDYDIIKAFMANYRTPDGRNLDLRVIPPRSNPPVRKRHNTVNAYCLNSLGQRRLTVYKDAPTADKALRLTQLRRGGQMIEDDSKPYQHIGTAIGYGLMTALRYNNRDEPGTIIL